MLGRERGAMNRVEDGAEQALRAPRAAAFSGIAFSLLFAAAVVLIRVAVPADPREAGAWLTNPARRNVVLVALALVPFAGIAFLWFIGVERDRMGQREDRLFASVFLGSGLLFVAMLFMGAATAGGLITSVANTSGLFAPSDAWRLARAVTYLLITTYAMRMAAVFMISTATITLQIAIMPRWLALLTYACAFVLLVSVGSVAWVEMLFPAWVFLVSAYILITTVRIPHGALHTSRGAVAPREGEPA
jgi:hypothetical protein